VRLVRDEVLAAAGAAAAAAAAAATTAATATTTAVSASTKEASAAASATATAAPWAGVVAEPWRLPSGMYLEASAHVRVLRQRRHIEARVELLLVPCVIFFHVVHAPFIRLSLCSCERRNFLSCSTLSDSRL
jgi:hypothetical protein